MYAYSRNATIPLSSVMDRTRTEFRRLLQPNQIQSSDALRSFERSIVENFSLSLSLFLSLSLPLSLSIYLPIYLHLCVYVSVYLSRSIRNVKAFVHKRSKTIVLVERNNLTTGNGALTARACSECSRLQFLASLV